MDGALVWASMEAMVLIILVMVMEVMEEDMVTEDMEEDMVEVIITAREVQ